MREKIQKIASCFDRFIAVPLRKYAIPSLRISIGIVFFWFGVLKIFQISPVEYLIEKTYPFLPYPISIVILGIWEALIGLGLIFRFLIRLVVTSLWLQIGGIFLSIALKPSLFYQSNIFILSVEGEFVVKNLIILAGSIVLVSYHASSTHQI